MRPAEVDLLIADPSKAREELGWEPSVDFEQLVKLMVDADLALLGRRQPSLDRVDLVGEDGDPLPVNLGRYGLRPSLPE